MIREIKKEDLIKLLELYMQLHENPMPEEKAELNSLWDRIIKDKEHHSNYTKYNS